MKVRRMESAAFRPFDVVITVESKEEQQMLSDFFGYLTVSDIIDVINKHTDGAKVPSDTLGIEKIRDIYDAVK